MKKASRLLVKVLLLLLVSGGIFIGVYKFSMTYMTVQNIASLESNIVQVAKEEEMLPYLSYINGIIAVESDGQGQDVMQASESKYGKRQQISSQKESLEAGIAFFKAAVMKVKQQKCDIWTAVQAYNFGLAYIDFVAQHGHKNTLALAEQYSKQLAQKDAAGEALAYRYFHLRALTYNGGYLYRDGGNFFYADKVRWMMKILRDFQPLVSLR